MTQSDRSALRRRRGDRVDTQPEMPLEPGGTPEAPMLWHLTRCWSGCERDVADWLTGLGFETFVPMRMEVTKVSRGRGAPRRLRVERPAIPGYVPARLPAAGHFLLALSPSLRPAWRWSPFAWTGAQERRPVIMRDGAVARLRQLDELGAFDAPEVRRPRIEKGDAVSFKLRNEAGQVIYEAVTVVIDIVEGDLRIGLRMLGKETTIPIEDVELVEKARGPEEGGAGGCCERADR